MAIPATPSNFSAQTGNAQNYLSWDLTATATSYSVQRSLDGVTFTSLATPAANSYLDTAVTTGILYYYQVAATNGSGTSPYTAAQQLVPTLGGEMSLGALRLAAQQRADRVNSNFVTKAEWGSYINQSMFELYDMLVTLYQDQYIAPPVTFYATGGNQFQYPLPDGATSFFDQNGNAFVPPSFYKLTGVDLGTNTASNGWVTVPKFNFIDRNAFFYPNTSSTLYGVFNTRYRLVGNKIEFIPTPSGQQPFRLWYVPRLQMLLQDTDITAVSISGWIEYVITDAAIKCLQKEESDVSVLAAQKMELIKRINDSAANRDAGQADTISDVRGNAEWESGWGIGRAGF